MTTETPKIQVRIVETSSRIVDIPADTKDEALDLAKKLWKLGTIVLGEDDFEGVEYKIVGPEQ
jgi:hypothetical protein